MLNAILDGAFGWAAESRIVGHAVQFANGDRAQGVRVKLMGCRCAGAIELSLFALHFQKRIPTFFHDLLVFAREVGVAIALKRQQRHGGGGGGVVGAAAIGECAVKIPGAVGPLIAFEPFQCAMHGIFRGGVAAERFEEDDLHSLFAAGECQADRNVGCRIAVSLRGGWSEGGRHQRNIQRPDLRHGQRIVDRRQIGRGVDRFVGVGIGRGRGKIDGVIQQLIAQLLAIDGLHLLIFFGTRGQNRQPQHDENAHVQHEAGQPGRSILEKLLQLGREDADAAARRERGVAVRRAAYAAAGIEFGSVMFRSSHGSWDKSCGVVRVCASRAPPVRLYQF